MSLISERIGYLFRRYRAEEIAEITGIALGRISPSLGELEPVDKNVRRNIYNLFNRTVYADLRAAGATTVEARRYRNMSVAKILSRLGNREELLSQLVSTVFQQRKESQIRRGVYISDEDTLAKLRESIARNMGKSKLPPSHYDYDSYATLEHGILDDDF